MPILKWTQEIARPVSDVFATVVDAGNFATWNPTIKSSRALTPGPVGNGARFEWNLRGFGSVRQELQEFERNRRVRIVPEMRALAGGHRFTFSDVDGKTRVDHELEMTPKGLFKLMSPVIAMMGRKNLRMTAQALQSHLES